MRIQFDIPTEQAKRLDELMRETDISTKKDLFNNALTLFEWAVAQSREGKSIAAVDPKDGRASKVVLMPAMQAAARKSQHREYVDMEMVPLMGALSGR